MLFRPADEDDLAVFLKALPEDIPVTMLGVGSNILIRDGGVRGVVIRLGRVFSSVAIEGDLIIAGAGASDINVAMAASRAGLGNGGALFCDGACRGVLGGPGRIVRRRDGPGAPLRARDRTPRTRRSGTGRGSCRGSQKRQDHHTKSKENLSVRDVCYG